MVGIGDADVRRSTGRNIRDYVIINSSVIGVEAESYLDIRIKRLEIRDGLLIDRNLRQIGIVFRPEGDLILL